MRPSNKQRSRNKQGNGGGGHNSNNNQRQRMGNIINRVFESAGPDGKVRGTPQQIIDKYQALARDAQVSGDRVAAESFLQHSEHYSRLLGEAQRHQLEQREREDPGRQDRPQDGGFRPQPPAPPSYGFGAIDEDEEPAGLIETPEGRADKVPLRPVSAPEIVEPAPVSASWQPDVQAAVPDAHESHAESGAHESDTRESDTRESDTRESDARGTDASEVSGHFASEPARGPDGGEAAPAPMPTPRRGRPRRRPKAEAAGEPEGEAAAVAD